MLLNILLARKARSSKTLDVSPRLTMSNVDVGNPGKLRIKLQTKNLIETGEYRTALDRRNVSKVQSFFLGVTPLSLNCTCPLSLNLLKVDRTTTYP